MTAALLLAAVLPTAPPGFNYEEEAVPGYTLPDVLGSCDSPEEWPERRAEIVRLFERHVYGVAPPEPESIDFAVEADASGNVEWRTVTITCETPGGPFEMRCPVIVPVAATAEAPAPVFVLINHRDRSRKMVTAENGGNDFFPWKAITDAGFAAAVVYADDLAPDDNGTFDTKLLKAYGMDRASNDGDRPADGCGGLAAWGWGASRVIDYCEQAADLDATRVAVVGHSRGGKAAWWAAARDDRFAIACSNNSGCGGAALSRRRFGETVARINDNFPRWFCPRFWTYDDNEDALPVDQHMLAAAHAPRASYAASAADDGWADPRGEFLSLVEANPAFELFGDPALKADEMPAVGGTIVRGRRGYHLRPGGHGLDRFDWDRYLAFASQLWAAE